MHAISKKQWFTVAVVFFGVLYVCLIASPAFAYNSQFGPERAVTAPEFHLEPNLWYGAFEHEYPIAEPPGRNKLEPNLKIQYSSQRLDQMSPLGYGWSEIGRAHV